MRIAVIGCGAIAESFHLPALARTGGGSVELLLVDPDEGRRTRLAGEFPGTKVASSYRNHLPDLDGAVIASPHPTHVPIALDLVAGGVPVLSEKPLGTSPAEVEELADRARNLGVPVAVNQTRRFIPACIEVGRILASGRLGPLARVLASEGDRFGWPAATPSMFGAASNGKGIVLDIGAHALDLLTWWLGGELELVEHQDDSFGGSEASSSTHLAKGSLEVHLRLSWLARQANRYRFEGANGALEWQVHELDRVTLYPASGGKGERVRLPGSPPSYEELADRVLGNFLEVVAGRARPAVTPEDVLPSIRLMDECYRRRTRYPMPWHAVPQGFPHDG
jgi:predicted dehydrogenase